MPQSVSPSGAATAAVAGPVRSDAKTPRGRESRARLIEAAREELIARDGVLEVDSVAQRAGTSIGLIYRHFESRAGLVSAVVDDFYSRFLAEFEAENPVAHGSSADHQRRHTESTVRFHYGDPLARVLLRNLHLDNEVAVAEAAQLDTVIERTADALRTGTLCDYQDSLLVAAMVVGGTRFVLAQCLTRGVSRETATERLWVFTAGILGINPAAADS